MIKVVLKVLLLPVQPLRLVGIFCVELYLSAIRRQCVRSKLKRTTNNYLGSSTTTKTAVPRTTITGARHMARKPPHDVQHTQQCFVFVPSHSLSSPTAAPSFAPHSRSNSDGRGKHRRHTRRRQGLTQASK